MIDTVENEKVKLSLKSIDTAVSKSILKDNRYNSRILYAGPKSSDSIVIYRLLEITRGRYALEQTVINTHFKSVQTTLASLNNEKFHKLTSAEEKLHQITYSGHPQILSAVSYARSIGSRTFINVNVRDHGSDHRSYWRMLNDCYMKYRMKSYLNSKI
jgi:hypothetical protein